MYCSENMKRILKSDQYCDSEVEVDVSVLAEVCMKALNNIFSKCMTKI